MANVQVCYSSELALLHQLSSPSGALPPPLGLNGWLRGRIRRELAGDDVCRPYPRQMALVEKDFLQLSEEGRTWLSTVMASSLM